MVRLRTAARCGNVGADVRGVGFAGILALSTSHPDPLNALSALWDLTSPQRLFTPSAYPPLSGAEQDGRGEWTQGEVLRVVVLVHDFGAGGGRDGWEESVARACTASRRNHPLTRRLRHLLAVRRCCTTQSGRRMATTPAFYRFSQQRPPQPTHNRAPGVWPLSGQAHHQAPKQLNNNHRSQPSDWVSNQAHPRRIWPGPKARSPLKHRQQRPRPKRARRALS